MIERAPLIGIIGDNPETLEMLKPAAAELDALSVPYEWQAIDAHYSPDMLKEYAEAAERRRLAFLIAGERGNSQLAGMLKAFSGAVNVLAVLDSRTMLKGVDSMTSVAFLPAKAPVAIMGFDKPGAINAAWFAADVLGREDPEIARRMIEQRRRMEEAIRGTTLE